MGETTEYRKNVYVGDVRAGKEVLEERDLF